MMMRDYYQGYYDALGLGSLPPEAFSGVSYHLDWYDTDESEALLHYQQHSFADFVQALRRRVTLQRWGDSHIPATRAANLAALFADLCQTPERVSLLCRAPLV